MKIEDHGGERQRQRKTKIKPADVASSTLNQPDWPSPINVSLYFPGKAIHCQVRWDIKAKKDCLDSN
jgi:hypothetical protein